MWVERVDCAGFFFTFVTNMNISAFLIGVATAFFAIFSLHILFWNRHRTRFQTVLGIIMAVWSVWCAKDLITTFPNMYREEVLRWIFIIDGWSALSYTVFIHEVVMPGWTTWRRLVLSALPFLAFTILYGVWPCTEVIYAYAAFLWCYAWAIVIVGWIKMQRYLRYVRREYSNIDCVDVLWLRPVFFFAIVGQLAWLFTSLYASVVADNFYYVGVILLWLLVLHYSWNFRPLKIEEDSNSETGSDDGGLSLAEPLVTTDDSEGRGVTSMPPLPRGKLERVVEEQKLYLHPNLTLQELAVALNTNRTYVSNYLSQTMGQTFYDYINQLRIKLAAIPLITQHPEYTFEYIASQSGFASMSTFRRAFAKYTGKTPSQYVAEVGQERTPRLR